jgi:hypothetical protein
MRYFMGLVLALVLAVMGCTDAEGTGGTHSDGGSGGGGIGGSAGGDGGVGGTSSLCEDLVCPCTEAGIRAAIAEGGGPLRFDCDGPTTLVTEAEIVIYNDVALDGGGNLTVDGNDDHGVFQVEEGVTAELRGFTVTGGDDNHGGGIDNAGTLTVTGCTLFENSSLGAIFNTGEMTIVNSTLSENARGAHCDSILNCDGVMRIISSTVSETMGGVAGNICNPVVIVGAKASTGCGGGQLSLTNTVVNAACALEFGLVESSGHNIESPGNTCGFDQPTDQVDVSEEALGLLPLADNGGGTMTHALGAGSAAIDQIPEADCVDAGGEPLTTDQRGEPRPETGGTMCDVGAFEVQP